MLFDPHRSAFQPLAGLLAAMVLLTVITLTPSTTSLASRSVAWLASTTVANEAMVGLAQIQTKITSLVNTNLNFILATSLAVGDMANSSAQTAAAGFLNLGRITMKPVVVVGQTGAALAVATDDVAIQICTQAIGGIRAVYNSLLRGVVVVIDSLIALWSSLMNALQSMLNFMMERWLNFLNPDRQKQAADAALHEQIRQAVEAELAHQGQVGNSANPSAALVAPVDGTNNSAALRAQLGQSFSDEVKVTPDPSGRAGVVTPVFRSGEGQPYIFIMTPLNTTPTK